jgi:PhzF family phenazine biosynthesis protein
VFARQSLAASLNIPHMGLTVAEEIGTRTLDLWQVDVFSDCPLSGNPAAVIFGGEDLADSTMQAVARETNLSETIFVLPTTGIHADYRARTFTTRREIAFAGHPTLAAAHAVFWRNAGTGAAGNHRNGAINESGRLRQECGAGIIHIERGKSQRLRVVLPPISVRATALSRREIGGMLGLPARHVVASAFPVVATGVPWLLAEVRSLEDLSLLQVDFARVSRVTRGIGAVGISVFTRACSEGVTARLRSFAPAEGIYEDPVCGSCHGATAAYLLTVCEKPALRPGERISMLMQQGHELQRPGLVEVEAESRPDGIRLWLGGDCVTVLRGDLLIQRPRTSLELD